MILKIYHDAICQPSPLAFAMVSQLGFLHAVIQQPQAFFLPVIIGTAVSVFSWAFRRPGLEKKPLDPRKANVNLSSPLELLEPGENRGAGRLFSKMCCDKTSKKCGKSWKRKCDSLTTYYFFGRQHRGFKVCVAQYLVKIDQSKFCSNGFKDSIRCVIVFFPKNGGLLLHFGPCTDWFHESHQESHQAVGASDVLGTRNEPGITGPSWL